MPTKLKLKYSSSAEGIDGKPSVKLTKNGKQDKSLADVPLTNGSAKVVRVQAWGGAHANGDCSASASCRAANIEILDENDPTGLPLVEVIGLFSQAQVRLTAAGKWKVSTALIVEAVKVAGVVVKSGRIPANTSVAVLDGTLTLYESTKGDNDAETTGLRLDLAGETLGGLEVGHCAASLTE